MERTSRYFSMPFSSSLPTQIERATIYMTHENFTDKEFLNSWFNRWAGAFVMRSQETITNGRTEMYDIIAPAHALNELPNGVVVRY